SIQAFVASRGQVECWRSQRTSLYCESRDERERRGNPITITAAPIPARATSERPARTPADACVSPAATDASGVIAALSTRAARTKATFKVRRTFRRCRKAYARTRRADAWLREQINRTRTLGVTSSLV